MMTPGCYMASIDLKDYYYTVNVDKLFRKYLLCMRKANGLNTHVYQMGKHVLQDCLLN
jgi:hypothetical protein